MPVANWVRALPAMFRPGEEPQIQADQAAAKEVAAVGRTCPAGTLHPMLEGEEPEQPEAMTTVTLTWTGLWSCGMP